MERLKGGIGQFLGIMDGRRPQPQPQPLQQLVGAKLQGEAREALIAALAVSTASRTHMAAAGLRAVMLYAPAPSRRPLLQGCLCISFSTDLHRRLHAPASSFAYNTTNSRTVNTASS